MFSKLIFESVQNIVVFVCLQLIDSNQTDQPVYADHDWIHYDQAVHLPLGEGDRNPRVSQDHRFGALVLQLLDVLG